MGDQYAYRCKRPADKNDLETNPRPLLTPDQWFVGSWEPLVVQTKVLAVIISRNNSYGLDGQNIIVCVQQMTQVPPQ